MDIFQAALNNDTITIREYLKFGDVNTVDNTGSSLLHYAARGNSIEVANLLLDNYINLNIVNSKGETPLFEAVSRGELGFCKVLCRYNADTKAINISGQTVYFKAILKGRIDILELLEDYLRIDYEFVNNNYENVLFYALKAYNNKLFIKLANTYPNLIKQRNYNNQSLLMLAIKYNNIEIFDYLFDKFNNLYESDVENNNIIFYAAKYAESYIMKKILDKNPIIAGKNKNNETIYDLCSYNPHPVNILLDNYNNSYEYKLYKKSYPFHIAIIDRNYDLLDYGNPDIKKRDAHGISILDYINMVDDSIIYKLFKLSK